ncbi:hypothetical protein CFC21_017981 [Triticum aestivum]|uniref:Uncharacterized protein n=3 Tax=Triticum TaxID=4564 RepID=A0A9R1RA90_TRITD|nr:hypothetical protein CFC21_017981 [Triticum aestivum]VAH34015.1 unnamed protein product [Triticum turgidum subsp. durum]
MTSDNIVVVPPLVLVGKNNTKILDYGCALLTSHDLCPPGCLDFFRILLIYNHHGGGGLSTVLRCYSSDTGRWGPETKSIVKIPSSKISNIGPAVIHRGVAYLALEQGVFGVRLDRIEEDHTMDMHLVPCDTSKFSPNNRLMGVSSDNRLFLMNCCFKAISKMKMWKKLVLKLTYLEFAHEDDIHTAKISTIREVLSMKQIGKQMEVAYYPPAIKLRWFGEKSGILLFTMGERSGHNGTYMMNLREQVVDKVADDGHSWKNLLGYEMDMAAYLVSVGQISFT